jgi:hypothetical protein
MYIENLAQSASILYRWYKLQEADMFRTAMDRFWGLLACFQRSNYVHDHNHVHANKRNHVRLHRSVVCDAEERVQVGIGVFGVCLGCVDVSLLTMSVCVSFLSLSLSLVVRFIHLYSVAGVVNVPPDDFGCSEGCDFAHSCFACLINDSLRSHSFFSRLALSRAVNDSWWYAP